MTYKEELDSMMSSMQSLIDYNKDLKLENGALERAKEQNKVLTEANNALIEENKRIIKENTELLEKLGASVNSKQDELLNINKQILEKNKSLDEKKKELSEASENLIKFTGLKHKVIEHEKRLSVAKVDAERMEIEKVKWEEFKEKERLELKEEREEVKKDRLELNKTSHSVQVLQRNLKSYGKQVEKRIKDNLT